MHSFLVALTLLTVLPFRLREWPDDATVARARLWFPAVGLLLGILLGVVVSAAAHLPVLVGAILTLIAWVGLTGALHLDGVGDLADGLFGGKTPEDRLRIMKDPHAGSFGVIGVMLVLLGKFAALAQLLAPERHQAAPTAVALAALVARCFVLLMAAGARYPREGGTGKLVIEATRAPEAALFAVLGVAAVAPLAPGNPAWLLAALLPCLAVLLLRRVCVARLGGVTGDCLGAAVELTELLVLLIAAAVA